MAKRKMSENSLKNIEPNKGQFAFSSDLARKAQIKSAKKKTQNAEARKAITREYIIAQISDCADKSDLKGDQRTRLAAFNSLADILGYKITKVAQTDSEGNDIINPPIINILPVEVVNANKDTKTADISSK